MFFSLPSQRGTHCCLLPIPVRCCARRLHITLKRMSERFGALPPRITIQFDNCGDNKAKSVLSYLFDLVRRGLLMHAEVGMLLVGHTHIVSRRWASRRARLGASSQRAPSHFVARRGTACARGARARPVAWGGVRRVAPRTRYFPRARASRGACCDALSAQPTTPLCAGYRSVV